jgi:hypothetical protein
MMDNVQKLNNCFNVPSSQTFRSEEDPRYEILPPFLSLLGPNIPLKTLFSIIFYVRAKDQVSNPLKTTD